MIMWIPQQISCGIHMIKVRALVPPGQLGRNGHARPRCESRERLVKGIARIPQHVAQFPLIGKGCHFRIFRLFGATVANVRGG